MTAFHRSHYFDNDIFFQFVTIEVVRIFEVRIVTHDLTIKDTRDLVWLGRELSSSYKKCSYKYFRLNLLHDVDEMPSQSGMRSILDSLVNRLARNVKGFLEEYLQDDLKTSYICPEYKISVASTSNNNREPALTASIHTLDGSDSNGSDSNEVTTSPLFTPSSAISPTCPDGCNAHQPINGSVQEVQTQNKPLPPLPLTSTSPLPVNHSSFPTPMSLDSPYASSGPTSLSNSHTLPKVTLPRASLKVPTSALTSDTLVKVPTSTSLKVPTSTSSKVPTSTSSKVPTSTSLKVPTSTSSKVPTSTSLKVPTSTSLKVPTSTSLKVPTSTSLKVPTSTSSKVPTSHTSAKVPTSAPSSHISAKVPTSTSLKVNVGTFDEVNVGGRVKCNTKHIDQCGTDLRRGKSRDDHGALEVDPRADAARRANTECQTFTERQTFTSPASPLPSSSSPRAKSHTLDRSRPPHATKSTQPAPAPARVLHSVFVSLPTELPAFPTKIASLVDMAHGWSSAVKQHTNSSSRLPKPSDVIRKDTHQLRLCFDSCKKQELFLSTWNEVHDEIDSLAHLLIARGT
ncbi:hypothetical protein C8R42DRAFT_409547 [Lentinula raphanica]|nr:hypothetical protein C8R42DRAFT_409547 [Lentinula raphanica]